MEVLAEVVVDFLVAVVSLFIDFYFNSLLLNKEISVVLVESKILINKLPLYLGVRNTRAQL